MSTLVSFSWVLVALAFERHLFSHIWMDPEFPFCREANTVGFATNWPSMSKEEKGPRPLGLSRKAGKIGWEEDAESRFLCFS